MLSKRVCRNCRLKAAQDMGLCRTCGRMAGFYAPLPIPKEAQPMQRRRKLVVPPVVELPPLPIQTKVIRGVEYDVVWNGSIR